MRACEPRSPVSITAADLPLQDRTDTGPTDRPGANGEHSGRPGGLEPGAWLVAAAGADGHDRFLSVCWPDAIKLPAASPRDANIIIRRRAAAPETMYSNQRRPQSPLIVLLIHRPASPVHSHCTAYSSSFTTDSADSSDCLPILLSISVFTF